MWCGDDIMKWLLWMICWWCGGFLWFDLVWDGCGVVFVWVWVGVVELEVGGGDGLFVFELLLFLGIWGLSSIGWY